MTVRNLYFYIERISKHKSLFWWLNDWYWAFCHLRKMWMLNSFYLEWRVRGCNTFKYWLLLQKRRSFLFDIECENDRHIKSVIFRLVYSVWKATGTINSRNGTKLCLQIFFMRALTWPKSAPCSFCFRSWCLIEFH